MDFANPENTALAGIEAFRSFLKSIGMPTTLGELGARVEDIGQMAHTACFGDARQGAVGGFVKLEEKDVAAILELAAE